MTDGPIEQSNRWKVVYLDSTEKTRQVCFEAASAEHAIQAFKRILIGVILEVSIDA